MPDDIDDSRSPASPAPHTHGDRSARHDGRALVDGDIRTRVQQVAIRQQRFERYLAGQLGVDHAGLQTMERLVSSGPRTPTELAQTLEVSTAAMTLVLNRLESAGHIRRDRHPTDGRKLVVTAEQASADQAQDLVLPLIDGVEQLIRSMTPANRRVVADFLDGLISIYDRATPGQ